MRKLVFTFLIFFLAVCSMSVSCNTKVDNFIAGNLTVTPPVIESGEPVLFEFWMTNKGDRGVVSTWTLEIDGKRLQEKEIRAAEKSTTRGYFRITAGSAGNHTAVVYNAFEQLSCNFTVAGASELSSID